MKNVLVILGVLAIVAIIAISIGGVVIYKKGSSAVIKAGEQEIERFISTKRPSAQVADSFRRLLNGVKLHKSWTSTMLIGMAMSTVQDNVVTDDEARMINDAASLAEQGEVTKEKMGEFMKKYENTMPRHAYQ